MSDKRVTIQRDIFYKAHLFLVHKDRGYSLKLYLQYLHVKTLSASFKHKKITKTNIQRTMFQRFIDDVLAVQQEGRQKRLTAEKELLNIENEWRKKLSI